MSSCVYIPKKGRKTFIELKNRYGYEKSAHIYNIVSRERFINEFRDSLKLDKEGIPTFDSIIKSCNCVFSQGIENYDLIDSIVVGKDKFYYPNYVMPDFVPSAYPTKPQDNINLLYFGRISDTKNVDIVLKSMSILH